MECCLGKKKLSLRTVLGAFLVLGLVVWGLRALGVGVRSREISLDLSDVAGLAAMDAELIAASDRGSMIQGVNDALVGKSVFENSDVASVGEKNLVQEQAKQIKGEEPSSAVKLTKPGNSRSAMDATNDRMVGNRLLVNIQAGDTLVKIFRRHHLKESDALQISRLSGASILRRLQVGRSLWLDVQDGKLQGLEYDGNRLRHLVVKNGGSGWNCNDRVAQIDSKDLVVSFELGRNLVDSCLNNGVPRRLINEISQALGQRVNLRSLKGGEWLSVAYRESRVNNELVKTPELVGLDYVAGDRKLRLITFVGEGGTRAYFTPDGHGTQSQFNRYPLSKFRISSKFTQARRHPIHGTLRPHLGVDLSASYGTPVYATSNGTIDFAGFYGGYGRLVVVRNGKYSTRYAHLSRFAKGVNRGACVKRGEVIGYVGSSGTSTSAHLHYEFRINGVPYDPVRVKLPGESLLASRQRSKFIAVAQKVGGYLDREQAKRSKALAVAARTGIANAKRS